MIKETKLLLKLSGKRSKPLVGEVRVKKIFGPPNAKMRDWDSSDVGAETIDFVDSTVLLYDKENSGISGINSLYATRPSFFSSSLTSPTGLRVSSIFLSSSELSLGDRESFLLAPSMRAKMGCG